MTNIKRRKIVLVASVVLLCIVMVFVYVYIHLFMVVGGEIVLSDIDDDVKIYIEEDYTLYIDESHLFQETSHSVLLVTDEYFHEEILNLCENIEKYREYNVLYDMMVGHPPECEYLPRIYIVTSSFCYRIEIINWESFAGDSWRNLPIREERFGDPIMHIFRIDLSLLPENTPPYIFAKEYNDPDSVNGEWGMGWYSTIPQESMDELLLILESVSADNAEIVYQFE